MISAIKEIGKLTLNDSDDITRTLDGKILSILVNTNTNEYSGIDIEDFDSGKIKQYLFKEGSSKGNVPSPFCPLTEPPKTYKKIEGWLKQCNDINADFLKDYAQLINGAFKLLVENKDDIINEITQKTKDFTKKTTKFLTIKINGKYLGEYEGFKQCLTYFEEAKRKKSANTGVCSICSLSNKEVSGKTDVFKFYTIDKHGFITGGFQEHNAWKNYPVCLECKTLLEKGKKFIENKLNFKFYGLNYFLIPRLLMGEQRVLEEIVSLLSDTTKIVALKDRVKKRITNDENEILEYISGIKDVLTINFLFLQRQRQQSVERILLLIEDVFPSRIRKIFEAKDCVDRLFDEEFNFGKIRTFFSKSDDKKRESDLNKYFLEIVDSVFKGRKLDFSFLLKFYMAVIRKEFNNDRHFTFRVKDALMNTIFFENLGLITFEEVKNMEESIFENVFRKYGNTFASPEKRGIFLLGALTQKLLNIQAYKRQGAKPFMKKLKSLKMDQKDIMGLLPDVQDKLEQYESFDTWRRLAQESSKYLLVNAGDDWKLSIDEINFYFACGMNLMEQVTNIIYPESKKEE
jgi:CRISPR-associated protein Csh1